MEKNKLNSNNGWMAGYMGKNEERKDGWMEKRRNVEWMDGWMDRMGGKVMNGSKNKEH